MKSRETNHMEAKIAAFAPLLLKWYHTEDKRSFPWRKSKNPYHILIAEIMLQRTKADQVVPTYLSFIHHFPSVKELSDAKLSEIKAHFSGLGLLWRAKNVKKLADKLVSNSGEVPSKREQLMSLPSVGEYVADAVLCFAYSRDTAIVDANVCRVIGRVFGLKPRGEARRDPAYRALAERLQPRGKCKEFNWAMIDHGSLICLSRGPLCYKCPLNKICEYALTRGMSRTA